MEYIEGSKDYGVVVGIDLDKNEQYVLRIISAEEETDGDYYDSLDVGVDIYRDFKFYKQSDYISLGHSDWKWVNEVIPVLEDSGVCGRDIMWVGPAVTLPDFIDRHGKTVKYRNPKYPIMSYSKLIAYHKNKDRQYEK